MHKSLDTACLLLNIECHVTFAPPCTYNMSYWQHLYMYSKQINNYTELIICRFSYDLFNKVSLTA
jgi:hypothetical protein